MISDGEALVGEAWALERLQSRFGKQLPGTLKAASTRLVMQMMSDHLEGLDRIASHLSTSLAGFQNVVPAYEGTGIGASTEDASLIHDAEELNRQVQWLFALGSAPQAAPGDLATALFDSLLNLQNRLGPLAKRLEVHSSVRAETRHQSVQEMSAFQGKVQK